MIGRNARIQGRIGTSAGAKGGDTTASGCCCCVPDCATPPDVSTYLIAGLAGGAGCAALCSASVAAPWNGIVSWNGFNNCLWIDSGGARPSIEGYVLSVAKVGATGSPFQCNWLLQITCGSTDPTNPLIWSGTKAGGKTPVGIYVSDGTGCDTAATLTVS